MSDAWTEATWLGAQALKNPLDLWVYQEIMSETRPELVVETGTYRGGSAFFLASICDLLGEGEIVSIDIEQVREDYPNHSADHLPRRPLLDRPRRPGRGPFPRRGEAHARDPRLGPLAEARRGRARRSTRASCPVGGYVIVEDSNIGQIRKDLLPGPLQAIETFLAGTDEFEIDRRARSS